MKFIRNKNDGTINLAATFRQLCADRGCNSAARRLKGTEILQSIDYPINSRQAAAVAVGIAWTLTDNLSSECCGGFASNTTQETVACAK